MPTRKSETAQVQVPPETAPKKGRGAASKEQPRVTGDGGAQAADTQAGDAKSGAAKSGGAAKTGATKSGGAAKSAGAAKTGGAAKSSGAAKSGGAAKTRNVQSGPDLRKDLRDFASGRPQGWNHEDWEQFLQDLQARGHNINDRDQIGMLLERERLNMKLESVEGLSPQRRKTLTEEFGTLWSLRNAGADEIARRANVPRELAEKVANAAQ